MNNKQNSLNIINDLMNQDEFKTSLDYYFGTFDETKMIIMLLKMYHCIKTQYFKKYNKYPSKIYVNWALLHYLQNSQIRSLFTKNTLAFMEDETFTQIKPHIYMYMNTHL